MFMVKIIRPIRKKFENLEIFPSIIIKKFHPGEEAKLFLNFLNHPDFPANRRKIISSFPELECLIHQQDKKKEKEAVQCFLRYFYQKHKESISAISAESQVKLAKNSPKALRILGEMMQHRWGNKKRYYATPTILPFSPFKKNRFYFSVLEAILKKTNHNPTFVAIHEISHFIFFDMLRQIEKEEDLILARDAAHYLKEALTAALLDMEPLRRTLKLTNYHGNPEIHELYVKPERGKTLCLKEYIKHVYIVAKKQKKPFKQTLKELILTAHCREMEFSKKRLLWNRYDKQIFSNPRLLREYRRPIKLQKRGPKENSLPLSPESEAMVLLM